MKTLDDCVDAALATLSPQVRSQFFTDPASTLRDAVGLKVEQASHLTERRNDGGACDGLSFLKDDVILYAPTPYSRRENFTLAHELGHWLVERTPDVFDWLVDQPDPGKALETVCDAIAQRLLLAGDTIDAVLQGTSVRPTPSWNSTITATPASPYAPSPWPRGCPGSARSSSSNGTSRARRKWSTRAFARTRSGDGRRSTRGLVRMSPPGTPLSSSLTAAQSGGAAFGLCPGVNGPTSTSMRSPIGTDA